MLEEEAVKPDQERVDAEAAEDEGSADSQPPEAPREPGSPLTDLQAAVFKRLIGIEARFQARLQAAKIELKPPDFTIPPDDAERWQKTDAATIWDRTKNRYEYARKINELSAKFGRIQPIVNDLKSLAGRFPASSCLKRHLAYFYFLLGNREEAIQCYQDAATSSRQAYDWFNAAVMALGFGKEEMACYSLEQVFHQSPITEEQEAWHIYVNLVKRFSNYPAMNRLCETTDRNLCQDEIVILLETGIYLLKAADK